MTVEAFLSRKPVVTTTDAGGPLEFVTDGETGWWPSPTPEALAARHRPAVGAARARACARWARPGRARVARHHLGPRDRPR